MVSYSYSQRFNLQPLTRRDAQASSFEENLSLDTPRTDAPKTLPRPVDQGTAQEYASSQIMLTQLSANVVQDALRAQEFAVAPMSDLQVGFVKLTKNLPIPGEDAISAVFWSSEWADIEHDAAELIGRFTTQFFSNLFALPLGTPGQPDDAGAAGGEVKPPNAAE
ncbi:MAG: hypothetical protein ACJ78Q_20150 [Chloroflexia bacterium]